MKTKTNGNVVLMSGNEACAEGALAAGVRFFAGYPISPSSEIAETMARRLPELGGKFIQMEDEIASVATIIGASLTGKKVMDATSGPGFSLKAENLGLAIMMEVPLILVDVQRQGPSTGMATSPSQGDVMFARWGTHGDHPIIAVAPASVKECFDLTVRAVNLSERYRIPVIVLMDAIVGHLREPFEVPETVETWDRPRPMVGPKDYKPYAPGPNGVPPMVDYGQGYHWYANSSMHDEGGFEATSRFDVAHTLVKRLHDKIDNNLDDILDTESLMLDDADIAIFAFGTTSRSAKAAIRTARENGIKVGMLRAKTLWPFPEKALSQVADRVHTIIVPEMNYGQIVHTVREVNEGRARIIPLNRWDARLITPEQVLEKIEEAANGDRV